MRPLAEYEQLTNDELKARIAAVRAEAGDRLVVMAHYYAPDEIVETADVLGDSLALAKKAAESSAEAVLFCGVYFMLETADILLNRPEKIAERSGKRALVMAPDLTAGCPMADMITAEQAENWKRELSEVVDFSEFTPITYVNSSAATKAFCGENGGGVCTSANAEKIVRWAFEQRPKLLFMPDSRLGRATALALGVAPEEIVVWKAGEPLGGLDVETVRAARVILWDGCCPIHQRFSVDAIRKIRAEEPNAQVWVHPESPFEVTDAADGYGSTTKLIDVVEKAADGSVIAVGTEWKLVDRMRRQYPTKKIVWPGEEPSICVDMSKSTLARAAWVLENWLAGEPVNVVETPETVAASAFEALRVVL